MITTSVVFEPPFTFLCASRPGAAVALPFRW